MIADILQRRFMIDQIANNILPELTKAQPADDRRAAEGLPDVSEAQLNEAAATLTRVLAEETAESSLTDSVDASRHPEDAQPPLDEVSFFSSRAEMGLLQSLLQQRYEQHAPEVIQQGAGGAAGDRRGPGGTPMVTGRSLISAVDAGRRLFGAFSETDVRWVACKFAEALTWFRGPEPFPAKPAPAFEIAGDARFVIVGDWGTGLDRAKKVAVLMRKAISAARRQGRQVHVIHLGDIYYAGTERECADNFLGPDLWPVREGEPEVYSWCLNGNHDMFSGGRGYFRQVLKDTRFQAQANSNRFELLHPKWDILGLDTAYAEHDLAGDQPAWVAERLNAAKQVGRKGLLLSHHQLFSTYESQGTELRKKLSDVLDQGLVHTWLWGHEHRLCLYAPYQGVQFARCIGHGGVPVYQFHRENDANPAPLQWEFRDSFRTPPLNLEPWSLFGFAVADFIGDSIKMRYIHENAEVDAETREPEAHKEETIPPQP